MPTNLDLAVVMATGCLPLCSCELCRLRRLEADCGKEWARFVKEWFDTYVPRFNWHLSTMIVQRDDWTFSIPLDMLRANQDPILTAGMISRIWAIDKGANDGN
jgi:hypothetical protein